MINLLCTSYFCFLQEPPNKGHIGTQPFCQEVVLSLEVENELVL